MKAYNVRVAVGADHAGFPRKGPAIAELQRLGHEVVDLGTHSEEPVDYPDFAQAVGEAIMRGEADRGVLICGSGVGASVAANTMPGIRAAVCHDTFSARQGVEDDDLNVLCLGAASSARNWRWRSSAPGRWLSSQTPSATCVAWEK